MSIKQKFKSTIGPQQYLFANGKAAPFVLGVYLTDDAAEIAELNASIRAGMPYIYQDPDDAIVDTTLQDKIRDAQKEATLRVMREHEKGEVVDVKTADAQAELDAQKDPVTQGGSGTTAGAQATQVSQISKTPANATLLNNLRAPANNTGVAGSSNVADNAAGGASTTGQ